MPEPSKTTRNSAAPDGLSSISLITCRAQASKHPVHEIVGMMTDRESSSGGAEARRARAAPPALARDGPGTKAPSAGAARPLGQCAVVVTEAYLRDSRPANDHGASAQAAPMSGFFSKNKLTPPGWTRLLENVTELILESACAAYRRFPPGDPRRVASPPRIAPSLGLCSKRACGAFLCWHPAVERALDPQPAPSLPRLSPGLREVFRPQKQAARQRRFRLCFARNARYSPHPQSELPSESSRPCRRERPVV